MAFLTDKVQLGYLPTYLTLAGRIGTGGRVCEVGVDLGYSLAMWQALFPQGLVVGVDHDPSAHWPDGTTRVVCEQDDPRMPSLVGDVSSSFDLIVDDASHHGGLTRATFELLWPLVTPGGWYVVEDWQVAFGDWPSFDASMLEMAQGLLAKLDRPDGEVAEVTYRYGMILARKRGP